MTTEATLGKYLSPDEAQDAIMQFTPDQKTELFRLAEALAWKYFRDTTRASSICDWIFEAIENGDRRLPRDGAFKAFKMDMSSIASNMLKHERSAIGSGKMLPEHVDASTEEDGSSAASMTLLNKSLDPETLVLGWERLDKIQSVYQSFVNRCAPRPIALKIASLMATAVAKKDICSALDISEEQYEADRKWIKRNTSDLIKEFQSIINGYDGNES